jgi:hypothetical protein
MPNVQIFLADQRLPVSRQLTALVRFVRLTKDKADIPEQINEVGTVDRVGNVPLNLDLHHGTWRVYIKTAYFPETVCVITVADFRKTQEITLQLASSVSRQPMQHIRSTNGANSEEGVFYRQLSPSRANTGAGQKAISKSKDTRRGDQSIFFVHSYNYKPTKKSRSQHFSELGSFDARMNYWLGAWSEQKISEPIQIWKDTCSNEFSDNIRVVEIRFDPSKGKQLSPNYKALLEIKFHDQTYSVVLPPNQLVSSSGLSASLRLEISFIDESIKCDPHSNRLINVRLYTNDPTFDAVTQFLADGETSNALKVWKSVAEDFVKSKKPDAVSAAAATIMLIHAYLSRSIEESYIDQWEHVLSRLDNSYKTLSDSAIVNAWIKALTSHDRETQITEAVESFENAVQRGLPVFTEAVRLLGRGAEWAYEQDSHEDKLNAIRWLTNHVLPGNSLTTIRHEESKSE